MLLFSIIIPVYNAEKTIQRCLDSILANSFKDYEILLIDDCSKDNSLSKCFEYKTKYKNIKVLKNDVNRGVSRTRNIGLQHASGEYLLFVDSDDWVENTYIAKFAETIQQGSEFSICGFYNHDEKYNKRNDLYVWGFPEEIKTDLLKPQLDSLREKNLLQQLWNKAFVTKIIKTNQIQFDESISIGEDFRFILTYLKVADVQQITMINTPLYHYMRDQEGSLMFHVGYERIDEPLKTMRMFYLLKGLGEEETEQTIVRERTNQEELYAYLILHNGSMRLNEKRKLVYNLNKERGKQLFYKNLLLYNKEKIARVIKKIECIINKEQ